jgi:ABC-type bacteriocin/lantibiotic exporter with double-glycine peptidase domain
MIGLFRHALSLLTPRECRRVYVVMLASAAAAVVQVVSILAIMPFIVLLANPDLLETNTLLSRINEAIGVRSYREFLTLFGLVGILVLTLGNLFVALEQWLAHRFFCHLRHAVEKRLLQALLEQSFEYFVKEHSAKLSDLVLRQVERAVEGVIGAFAAVFSGLVLAAFIVVLLLVVSFQATLVSLIGLLVAYLALFLLMRRRIQAHGEELTRLSAALSTAVKETFDGIHEIRTRRAGAFFARRFATSSLRMAQLEVRFGVLNYLPYFILEAIVFSGFVAVALWFLVTTEDSGISLSYLALYGIAVYRLIPALKGIFEGLSTIQHNADAVDVIRAQITERQDVVPKALPPLRAELRMERVSYRHVDSEYHRIDDVDLVIPAGTSLCLFGSSGSGKTTILNLLAGLIRPEQGRVLCDGVEIGPETIDSWRGRIGYAPQKVYLFDDSIASNIAFGLPHEDIDMERVVVAATLANLHEFVIRELAGGYHALIGEQGASLSGGQRQRVGIARTLYHDPEVLIFDESFTGLDAANRDAILDNLFRLAGKTLIFSSHEPAIASRCGRTVTVERGRVREER